jgi:hypothetical protein
MTRLNPFAADGKKRCVRCNEVKEFADFDLNRGTVQSHCRPCRNEYKSELRKKLSPEERRAKDRLGNLRKYGITLVEWEAMFERQERTCAICRRAQTNGHGWHTDHCHETGKVRGILCHDCNVALGAYERTILPNLERFREFVR